MGSKIYFIRRIRDELDIMQVSIASKNLSGNYNKKRKKNCFKIQKFSLIQKNIVQDTRPLDFSILKFIDVMLDGKTGIRKF